MHSPFYPKTIAEIVVEEEAARNIVQECLEATGQSNDKEPVINVIGGGKAGLRSGAETVDFTFVDALRRATLIAAIDPETVIDTSGMPTCKWDLYDNL